MRRSIIVNVRAAIAAFAALIALPAAAQETYEIDPVHSQPQWEARHIGFSNQHGSFGKATGKVTLDRAARKGTIDVTIDAASIRTYSERLDPIVKGEQFFNVEKFPTITFKSNNVMFDGDRVVGADGELTMLGITRPVSLRVVNFVCGEQTFNKKPMCGAEATATIKRSEWGMIEGLKIGNPSDEIKLTIPVEAYREQPQG
jgi:polyisoprenoid-binding protein YceI